MSNDEADSLSENEYYVEEVLDKRIFNGKTEYLIKWEGWSEQDSTWEPIDNLQNIKNLIDKFEKERKEAKKRRLEQKLNKEADEKNAGSSSEQKTNKKPRLDDKIENRNSNSNIIPEKEKSNAEALPTDFEFNEPEEVISVRKEGDQIRCFVRFKERSDGVIPENSYISSSVLKELYPKILINYYESKIKFIDRK